MAQRVNKKLVVIVASCVAITVVIVGLVFAQQWRGDPMRHIRAGDALYAQQDYRGAAREYGRAVGKRSGEVAFYDKYLDALSKVIPTSKEDAAETFNMRRSFLIRRAQVARDNEALWRNLLEEARVHTELNDTRDGWEGLAALVKENMVNVVQGNDKLTNMANALIGYARARQLGALTPEEQATTIETLDAVSQKADGADQDLAYGGLLAIRLSQALNETRAGRQRQADEAWKLFDSVLAKAVAAQPEGMQTLVHQVQRLAVGLQFGVPFGEKPVAAAEVTAAADRLVARATALDSDLAMVEAAKAVATPGVPSGMATSAALLSGYVQKHPDALAHRQLLAISLQGSDPEAAKREAMVLIEKPQLPVSMLSANQDDIRIFAAQQIFDIEFDNAKQGLSAEEAAAQLARLDTALNRVRELARGRSDDSIVLAGEGKRAFVAGDLETAYTRLNEVIRKGTVVTPQTYWILSIVAEQRKETGLAEQYVADGLQLAPESVPLMQRRGELAFRNGRFAVAEAAFAAVLSRDPENKAASNMLAAARRQATSSGVDVNDPLIQAMSKVDQTRVGGDIDGALKLVNDLLADHPDDLRVIILGILCEMDAKHPDKAKELLQRGFRLQADHPTLRSLAAMLAGDDPLTRVKAAIEQEFPNEPDRTVWMAIRLTQFANTSEVQAKALESSNPAESQRISQELPAIRAAAEEARTKAEAVGASNPAWLDYRLTQTLLDRDFEAAKGIVADAERAKVSMSTLAIFRGRLALAQGNNAEARTLLQKAIDANADDADVFKMLGNANERMGDMDAALKAYAEAYRRKPNDVMAAKFYVASLVKTGDRANALTVLREVRKVAFDDADIGDTWLDLEREIGDRQLARRQRQGTWELVPGNRTNAIKYATMLAELEPDRLDIDDSAGKIKYTDGAWRALDERVRQGEIQRVRDIWQKESDAIFAQLLAKEPGSLELALLRAATARRQGRIEIGENALRALIANAGDKATPQMYAALGVHLAETDQPEKAKEAFASAIKVQDEKREGDIALAEYFFQRERWADALIHLESLSKIRSDGSFLLRLAETQSRVGKFDEARATLATAKAKGDFKEEDTMLDQIEASMAETEAKMVLRSVADEPPGSAAIPAKLAEVVKVTDAGLAATKRAAAKAPGVATIPVQEAWLQFRRYQANGDAQSLEAAISAADRATRLRGDYWGAAQAKADFLQAAGKPGESIIELERFIKAAPSVADARRALIARLAESFNFNRAIDVAKEAIAISPNDPQWRSALASVYAASNQVDLAIIAAEQADRLRPTEENLGQVIDLRLRQPKPAWNEILVLLRDRESEVRGSPYFQSTIGVALAKNGDTKSGLEVMRSSYAAAQAQQKDWMARKAQAEQSRLPVPVNPLDAWFRNLRLIYPSDQTSECEAFVMKVAGDKPTTRDLRWLAELWFASGPSGSNRTIEIAEKGIASDDGADKEISARLYDLIGSARYGQGDCAAALASFGKAKEILPTEPSVLNNFAFLAAECGDLKDAISAATEAVRISKGAPEYLDTLGYAQLKAGMLKEAEASFRSSIKASPTAAAHLHLAQVLLQAGNKEEARQELKAAGDLRPDAPTQKQINDLIGQLG